MKNNHIQKAKYDNKILHREFVQLGRERNKITYKLLALLPKIHDLKIYEKEGYANIYDYAAKIAGLSSGVVKKAIKLEQKLSNLLYLQEAIKTQGINKVGIIAGIATKENEKDLAEKVENMSKPALQEYSKEVRGKITTSWKIELDEEMMFLFLKLKKKLGKNLNNKEGLRKILEQMNEDGHLHKHARSKNPTSHSQAKNLHKIPEEKLPCSNQYKNSSVFNVSKSPKILKKITRYIPIHQKRKLSQKCQHPNCHRPAEIVHHIDRFSQHHNHKNLQPLCKQHHEFAHNGISEPLKLADYQYRKYRQAVLL